jgi:hypothetical protein
MFCYDPNSCSGGNVATGRVFHAVQIKGDDIDKKELPGSPYPVLGVWLKTHSIKILNYSEDF